MVMYKNYDEALPVLETWLKTQPHLPIIEKIIQRIFIQVCEGDLEKTKKVIETNYCIRNAYPHIFLERDPMDELSQLLWKTMDVVTLPTLDANGYRINFCRFADPDPEKFYYTEMVKLFLMVIDSRLPETPFTDIDNGEITIFDMTGFTLKHLAKYNFTTLRIMMKFVQEGISLKIRGSHIINCPTYIDKVLAVVKPFMSAELLKLMHFHQPNSETLYEYVPKDLLPNEYGGKAGNIADLKKSDYEKLQKRRNYIMDRKNWVIDESKRPKHQSKSNALDGNFRTLSID